MPSLTLKNELKLRKLGLNLVWRVTEMYVGWNSSAPYLTIQKGFQVSLIRSGLLITEYNLLGDVLWSPLLRNTDWLVVTAVSVDNSGKVFKNTTGGRDANTRPLHKQQTTALYFHLCLKSLQKALTVSITLILNWWTVTLDCFLL